VSRRDARARPGARETGAPPAVRAALAALFAAALAALEPRRLVRRALGGRARRALPLERGVVVVGAGKGAAGLAAAVEAQLGAAVAGGVVIVPPGYERRLARVELAVGDHPLPDRRSAAAARRLLAALARAPEAAVVVVLTGGASSLLVAPAPGLTLADKRRTHALLLASGADIGETNAVRKHLSAVKGGRLAERLAGRPALALVVSDVPGDELAVVGSGPTVGDPTTYAAALAVLATRGLLHRVPARVRRHLGRGAAGALPETPKPGGRALRRVRTLLLAGNATARAGVSAAARRRGYPVVAHLRRPVTGDVRDAARLLAARILRRRAALAGPLPAALVAGGETTVAVGPAPGRGGRNQELALEVARALAGRPGWALLCASTDGIDGPTDAAGAFADGATVARARRAGLSIEGALARHDAYPLLRALGDLYRPGPTGTNVADLALALVWRDRGWRLPGRVVESEKVP
jgi:glycerate 2-kinase